MISSLHFYVSFCISISLFVVVVFCLLYIGMCIQDTIRQLSAENAGLQNMLLTLHHQTQNESSIVSEISDSSSGSNVDIQNHKTTDDVDHVFDSSTHVHVLKFDVVWDIVDI